MKKLVLAVVVIALALGVYSLTANKRKSPDINSVKIVAGKVNYPTKPITIIVPWAAGGGGDTAARTIAKGLEKELKTTVVINNIVGGSGIIGIGTMAQAAPDGYTLGLLVSSGVDMYPFTTKVPYTIDDLEFIGNMVTRLGILTASIDSGIKNVEDLKAAAAKETLNWGTVPTGQAFMSGYQFFEGAGLLGKVKMIPYSGGASEAAAAVVGGHVDIASSILADQMENIRAGKVRLICILGDRRIPNFPDVFCSKELGIDVDVSNSVGLIAPAGLKPEVKAKLENAIAKSMQDPEVLKLFANAGDEPFINYRDSKTQKEALLKSMRANYSIMEKAGMVKIKLEDSGMLPKK